MAALRAAYPGRHRKNPAHTDARWNLRAMTDTNGQIAIYQTADGRTQIDVRVEKDTLWLTLLQMAELFDRDKSVISRHLKNIFDTGELPREATVAKTATVQTEGGRHVSREIEYFNLDAVISVGYRVNSIKGTQFRIWATQRLREYLVQVSRVTNPDVLFRAAGQIA